MHCTAVVVLGSHGRVVTAHQIAPCSRGSDLLSPTVWTVSNFLLAVVRAVRCQSHAGAQCNVVGARMRLAGHGHDHSEQEVGHRRARRGRGKSTILLVRTAT